MEWKEVRLGDVVEIVNGFAFKSKAFTLEGIPVIKIKNIKAGKVILNDLDYISTSDINPKYTKIRSSDILITMTGNRMDGSPETWVGKVSLFRHQGDFYLNQRVSALRLIDDTVDNNFLSYYLSSWQSQLYFALNSNSSGGQANITPAVVQEYRLMVPELETQRSIASILSSLDRKIELNNKINADLEEMAQAIFKNWFVDFEPFKDGRFVDSELGMIPEGWKVGSPYEYAKVVYGAPYKSAKFNDNGEGLPLIRIRDLKNCNPQFYTPEILPQTEYVNMGDIVAGMDAEFVPHIWKGNTGLLNQRVCKLMPQQTSISNLFVLYLMKPELEFVQSYKTGTTVSHLGKADIDKFVVVLPPLEVVEECSKILDSILQRIKNISAESRTLSTLRDTLLPRLMSGELEIPE